MLYEVITIQTPDRYFGWVDEAAITRKSGDDLKEWKNQEKVIYKQTSGHGYNWSYNFV